MHISYRKIVVLVAALCMCATPLLSVSADEKEVPKPLVIVSEPDEVSDGVYYVDGGTNKAPDAFAWADGGADGEGTALELNGQTQFIRLSTEKTNSITEFTLSAWFKAKEGLEANQSFLLSVFQKNTEHRLTLSPHSEKKEENRNGIHLEFKDPQIEDISLYHETSYPLTSALPVNEWHHFAVRFSESDLSLYVDGAKYAEQALENFSFNDVEWQRFIIGGDIHSQAAFSGWLDEVYLYTEALDDNQIGLLAAGYEPKPGVAPPVHKEHLAIRPIVEAPNLSNNSTSVLGLSPSLFTMIGTGAILVLLLSLVVSSYKKSQEAIPEEDHL